MPAPPPAPDREPSLDASSSLPPFPSSLLNGICDRFVRAWSSGEEPRIEDYLSAVPVEGRSVLLLRLLHEELTLRKQSGQIATLDDYRSRFPHHQDTVAKVFALTDARAGVESQFNATRSLEEATQDSSPTKVTPGTATSAAARYHKVRKLGEGAFGAVWLAEDRELRRQVP